MDLMSTAQLLGNFGEFVGSIGVLATLIYLAFQIRQNSASLRVSVEQSISNSFSDLYQEVASSDLAYIFVRASEGQPLTVEEGTKFGFLASSLFRKVEQAHLQYVTGNLSEESWAALDSSFSLQIQSSAGLQNYWEVRGKHFREEFRDHIEAVRSQPTEGLNTYEFAQRLASGPDD